MLKGFGKSGQRVATRLTEKVGSKPTRFAELLPKKLAANCGCGDVNRPARMTTNTTVRIAIRNHHCVSATRHASVTLRSFAIDPKRQLVIIMVRRLRQLFRNCTFCEGGGEGVSALTLLASRPKTKLVIPAAAANCATLLMNLRR